MNVVDEHKGLRVSRHGRKKSSVSRQIADSVTTLIAVCVVGQGNGPTLSLSKNRSFLVGLVGLDL